MQCRPQPEQWCFWKSWKIYNNLLIIRGNLRYFHILLNRVFLETALHITYVLNNCIRSACHDFSDFLGLTIPVRYKIALGTVINLHHRSGQILTSERLWTVCVCTWKDQQYIKTTCIRCTYTWSWWNSKYIPKQSCICPG